MPPAARPHDPATEERAAASPLADLLRLEPEVGRGEPGRTGAAARRLPERAPARGGRRRGPLRGLAATAAKAAMLSVLGWGFLFNLSEVRGSSMEPGIHDRDRILVDHLTYVFGEVERGDIAVLRYPLDPSLDYIKRVIGLPGEELSIVDGEVWIDGERLDEPYLDEHTIDPTTRMHTRVREGHYFVLGDNRIRSSDSREFGQVPFEYLRGKVRLRLWPFERAGVVE